VSWTRAVVLLLVAKASTLYGPGGMRV